MDRNCVCARWQHVLARCIYWQPYLMWGTKYRIWIGGKKKVVWPGQWGGEKAPVGGLGSGEWEGGRISKTIIVTGIALMQGRSCNILYKQMYVCVHVHVYTLQNPLHSYQIGFVTTAKDWYIQFCCCPQNRFQRTYWTAVSRCCINGIQNSSLVLVASYGYNTCSSYCTIMDIAIYIYIDILLLSIYTKLLSWHSYLCNGFVSPFSRWSGLVGPPAKVREGCQHCWSLLLAQCLMKMGWSQAHLFIQRVSIGKHNTHDDCMYEQRFDTYWSFCFENRLWGKLPTS